MNAAHLYQQLERDFVTPQMTDSWAQHMGSISDYLSELFKQRSMGLVCDHAETVNKVYTAVFASNDVMQMILDRGETDILLFVHHPATWDIRTPEMWLHMDRGLLERFRTRRISIFNFHVPLDNYGEYSTTVSLARRVGIDITKPFFNYRGAMAAVFGKTKLTTVGELARVFETVVGHRTSLYGHGAHEIRGGLVGVTAGGGNLVEVLEEIVTEGCNTYVTGITVKDSLHQAAHDYASAHGINILGGTHYSTEKPGCQAMCRYFESLGLPSSFVDGVPIMEDL